MNTNEKDIDRLTRGLMRDAAEQPSSSLNARIMKLIRAEKKRAATYRMRRLPPMSVVLALFAAYMLLMSGALFLYKDAPESATSLPEAAKGYFPLLLTVGAGISFCYFFAELDKWLRRRNIGG